MKITRINVGGSIQPTYVDQQNYDYLISFIKPEMLILEEDMIDFVVSQTNVCQSLICKREDTLIITSDTHGSFSSSRSFRRLSTLKSFDINTNLRCLISYWNDRRVEIYPEEDSNPVDIIVRTNRKRLTRLYKNYKVSLVFETHWRGPWFQENKSRWVFRQHPVYFVEIEVDDFINVDDCHHIINLFFS